MWGEWFGKPHDNIHSINRCSAVGSTLMLEFNNGEILTVENPEGIEISDTVFSIRSASAVRWEWFYYGRPQVSSNLYFMEFERSAIGITASSNIDFYQPNLNPTIFHPAVEIV